MAATDNGNINIMISVRTSMACSISILSFLGSRNATVTSNKKAVLSQRWPHDVPYIWVSWKFLNVH